MEEPELDTQYDVIVVGTGLVESVVAAAAARIGKKILHIDRNDYYGGQWASFNFQGIREWIRDATNPPPPQQQQQFPGADELVLAEGESLVAVGDPTSAYFNVNHTCHMPEEAPAPSDNDDAASPQQEISAHQSSTPETEEEAHQSQTTKETPSSPDTSGGDDDVDVIVGTSEGDENVSASVASKSGVVAEEGEENAHAKPPLPTTTTTTTEEEENTHAGPPLSTTTTTTTTEEEENTHAEKSSEESHKTTAEANDSTAGNMITPAATEESEKVWSHQDFVRHSRKFNIDLAPKLLYSRGPLVELLISSNVARYTEFKCITRVLTWMMTTAGKGECEDDGGLLAVPCSRSDVFTTSAISLVEKRLLMKFLQFCSSYEKHQDQLEEFQERTFGEFLKCRGLTANLIHFVTAAMAMVGPDEPCQTGLERTRLFLASLGRYGSTPFLFSMYGCGELPQAFCRLCAVFEGTYVLRKPVSHLVVDGGDKRCIGLVAEGRRFGCDNLVMSSDLTPSDYHGDNGAWSELRHISRAILFTDRSILPHKEQQLTLLRLPPTPDNPQPVTVIEGGSYVGICPPGVYCLQLSCLGKEAEVDLAGAVRKLVEHPGGPTLLWSLYFNQVDVSGCDLVSCCPTNLYLCPGPDSSLDYDAAITQARTIFFSMFPDETFLPRAPDPDEIVFDNIGAEVKDGDYFEEEGSSRTEQENRLEGQETGREEAVSEGQDSEDNNAQVNETKEEVTSKGV